MNYREGIPPDCVGVNVRYTVQRIPQSYIGTENYFDVYVSQVDSPGRLYIQLKATTTTDALEDLMDDLEAIYWGPEGVEYQMPDFMFQVGQVCAAVFPQDNNWHRCCITKVLPNSDVVEVYFVDYGNRCCVKRDKCRLLKSKFIALPAQAIQAKLANIIPANGHKWTRSSQERVLSLVSNKCILAMVLGVENRVCNVCLCDTCTTEEDIHVNDVLCYEGFAMFVTDDIPDEREFDLESTPPSSVSGHDEVDAGNHPEKTRPTLRQLSSLLTAPPEAKPQQEYPFTSPSQSHTGSFETGANSFESEEEDEYIRYVLETKIGNFGLVHVINYGGTAYVHSSQISSYLWENDCLKTRLRQKRLVVPKVMVSLEDDPELFDEFDYYKVKGTVNAEGKCTDIATLYELKSLPRILQAFNYPDPKLIDIFKELYDQFDPDDPYWQGADEESEGDKSIDPKLEDLERTLRLLQFRKKLLSRQIDVGIPDAKDEENLKEVEQLISDMTKSIAQMKAGENGPTSQIKQSSQKNNSVNSQSKVVSPAVTSSGAMQPRLSAAAVDAHEINQALTHMNLNQHRNTYQQQQLPIHYQNQPVNNMMMPNHPPGFGLSHLPAQQPPPVMQLGRGTPIGAQQHVLAAHHQLSGMNISPYATTVPTVQAPFGRGQLLVNNMAAVNNGAYNHVLMPPGASMTTQQQQRQNAAQFYSGFQLVAKPTTMNPYAPSFHPGQSKT
ncbi:uncharacterized protein LOC141909021 [Tubulanus polymorphus]|uniref:uncharacterized protein LOC141909021 n=1 Tax=Tubulanus polymorphus TaxID=672921 RepID=UPI003DA47A90